MIRPEGGGGVEHFPLLGGAGGCSWCDWAVPITIASESS